MSELLAPTPSNVRLGRGVTPKWVESDVHNIATRIKELDPRLGIVIHEGDPKPFVVVERCDDGQDRFVKRYAQLDARVLEDLRYMLAVPLEERMEKIVRQIDKEQAEKDALPMPEEQWDEFTHSFHKELVRAGLSHPHWFRSYRPRRAPG